MKKNPTQKRTWNIKGVQFYIQDVRPDGTPIIIQTKNRESSNVIKTSSLYNGGSLGLNIQGQNMVAGVWDGGLVRVTHELYQGRAIAKDGATNLIDHICHVTGTVIGGDIAANPAARGMAFNATAWCYDWNSDATEYSAFGSAGYLVSNHSYGRGNTAEPIWSFGAYDGEAKNLDQVLVDRPNYLQCWAAGNEQQTNNNKVTKFGYDVFTGTSASKNILAVGAVTASGAMSTFSNWGPTDDGRIKPDICAKGVSVTSAYSASDVTYSTGNGTSFATPAITGTVLILQQYYKSLNPTYLDASGVRGLLLHTATDLGQAGPDYKFGWGLANAEKAANTITTSNSDLVAQNSDAKISKISTNPAVGSSLTYQVRAKDASTPLSISICWTDDPGVEQTAADGIDPTISRLVYNFDLTVTDPNGTTIYYPWSGPGMANRTALSTRTAVNDADNFERVDIDAPVANGVYTINILKRAGSPVATRAFTLIATGLKNTATHINFGVNSFNATEETSGTANTCLYYKDYPMTMNVNVAPVGAATVTLVVDGTSTALEGKDFDVSTNGVFGTGGSKILTFADAATTAQNYTVRVYNDAIVEPNEIINLKFTTTGGNAEVGTNVPTQAVTIIDNDHATTAPGSATSEIGNNAGSTNQFTGPSSEVEADTKTEHYFLASELTAAGLVAGNSITGLSLNITILGSGGVPLPNFNISMAHTTASPTTSSEFLTPSTGFTSCYSNSSFAPTIGDNNIAFTSNFVWNGTDNVIVRYCMDGTADRTGAQTDEYKVKFGALGSGVHAVVINAAAASAGLSGCSLPTTTSTTTYSGRPITKFSFMKSGTAIETVLNESKTENVSANASNYDIYSASNKLLATVGGSNQDLGCVAAKVEAAGNGFAAFGTGSKSNKVVSITPSTNGSTASYTVSIYMTTAELAGQNVSTFQIYKSSAANAAGITTGNTVTAPTTVVSNADYTKFTANFTGFSLFFVGSPSIPLPINWIDVTAAMNAEKHAVINWEVNEVGVNEYVVTESRNNTSFSDIGELSSEGNGRNTYSFSDSKALEGTMYYRIKQIGKDGSSSYSPVLKLTNQKSGTLAIYPNPSKGIISVSAATVGSSMLLTDVNGRILQQINVTKPSFSIDIHSYSAGIYFIKTSDGSTHKLVKE